MSKETKPNVITGSDREELAQKLSMVGDASRLNIICLLVRNGGLCVSEVAKLADLSVANASYHLNALAEAGICSRKRAKKKICYTPSDSSFMKKIRGLICKNK